MPDYVETAVTVAAEWFLIGMIFYSAYAFDKGLRQMSAPSLSLGQRKVIGIRMLIHIALMGVIALIVVVLTLSER